MIKKARLFTPGPTALHPEVQAALARPIVHHRTDEFRALIKECTAGLKAFLRTEDDVITLASSGSGGMEAALVNVLSPGDKMLALVAGKFGQRWEKLGRAYGMKVASLGATWGEAVTPAAVAEALERDAEVRAVFCQFSESSTGVAHDVKALAEIVHRHPDTLLVVDAISGAGAMTLETQAWGIDLVVVGSQKALSLPPGLAFVSVSERAWKRVESTTTPRFYFDLRRERAGLARGEPGFTPAIALVVALKASLDAIAAAGGVESLVANAGLLARMTRAAAKALGLPLVAPRDHGDALTALFAPQGLDATAIVKGLKSTHMSTVAGGQGELKGKIFRVAHLGYYDVTDILGLLSTLETVLQSLGHKFDLGCGVAAAQAEFIRHTAGR
jgi:aspartate aminotransferase-like enzyme